MDDTWCDERDDEPSDFVCIECGEDLGPDETCETEDCPLFGAEDVAQGPSDAWLRQQERKQMGVGS